MNGLHVGIIMDGNGRWAKQRGRPRWRGHLAGVDSVRDVVEGSPDIGVTTLTLYAFSSDNWSRPSGEVRRLMWLLREYCRRERAELLEKGVRVTAIGRRDRLPTSALAELETTERVTAQNKRLHLRLAIDYGAREEITRAAREIARQVAVDTISPEDITPQMLARHLYGNIPVPDLIIRTAGEQRLSDFLLWESAYAELYSTPVFWPDFRRGNLALAISEFYRRERRFGGVVSVRGQGPEELAAG
jgi:undecaprenyl diphosphate synthase